MAIVLKQTRESRVVEIIESMSAVRKSSPTLNKSQSWDSPQNSHQAPRVPISLALGYMNSFSKCSGEDEIFCLDHHRFLPDKFNEGVGIFRFVHHRIQLLAVFCSIQLINV